MPKWKQGTVGLGTLAVAIVVAAGGIGVACSSTEQPADARPESVQVAMRPLGIDAVRIDDPFWTPKLETFRVKTIADVLTKFDRDGAMQNFDLVRDGKSGGHRGQPWFDGLVYETIAGAADFLRQKPDPALEGRLDAIITRIAAASAKDPAGYLNTYTTLMEPGHRWGLHGGNDRWQHDLYNAGCLIEAGVRYYRATGKTALLEAGVKIANLMCETFGPAPRKNVIPGHALPEAAMLELRELFMEKPELRARMPVAVDPARYLELAEFWVGARGNHAGRTDYGAYNQDHRPITQQETIEGHAVRAALLAESVATLAGITGREEYRKTARRWWASMVDRRMYVTGGVGAVAEDEKFGGDYELPNNGYLETCGSVAAALFHKRMALLQGESRYADELERVLYNGVLGGVSHDGVHYFYENPLDADAKRARWAWHSCPCCPPMLLKVFGELPGMIYAANDRGVAVNLYIGSTATFARQGVTVGLQQISQYPWRGESRFVVDCERPVSFELAMRVPAWCQGTPSEGLYRVDGLPPRNAFGLLVNGQFVQAKIENGYAKLTREWRKGDRVDVTMDMPVRRIVADERVQAARGRAVISRGPLIYGIEGVDHGGRIAHLWLPDDAAFSLSRSEELDAVVIRAEGRAAFVDAPPRSAAITAVPYYAMANRGPSSRTTWLPRRSELATPLRPESLATVSASHVNPGDSPGAMNDAVEPKSSHDESLPRFTWWDHRGTAEWAAYEFASPVRVSSVQVYWWDERATNRHCRVPKSWRLMHRTASGGWAEVRGASGYGTELDAFNRVTFDPVETTGLRIEAQLQEGWSGGILEWKLDVAK